MQFFHLSEGNQMSTYPYASHDEGIVLTQPRPGEFEQRPMTPAELAAREPALAIAKDIYRHANQAGVCYIEMWELIAQAIQRALDAPSSDVPHRAVRIKLDLEADSREAIISALANIERRVAMHDLTEGCSGGYDSGYTYTYTEAERPTHDEYAQALKDWLAARNSSRCEGETAK